MDGPLPLSNCSVGLNNTVCNVNTDDLEMYSVTVKPSGYEEGVSVTDFHCNRLFVWMAIWELSCLSSVAKMENSRKNNKNSVNFRPTYSNNFIILSSLHKWPKFKQNQKAYDV